MPALPASSSATLEPVRTQKEMSQEGSSLIPSAYTSLRGTVRRAWTAGIAATTSAAARSAHHHPSAWYSIIGLVLTAGTAIFEPALGVAKQLFRLMETAATT